MMPLNQVIAINDVNSNYDGLAECYTLGTLGTRPRGRLDAGVIHHFFIK